MTVSVSCRCVRRSCLWLHTHGRSTLAVCTPPPPPHTRSTPAGPARLQCIHQPSYSPAALTLCHLPAADECARPFRPSCRRSLRRPDPPARAQPRGPPSLPQDAFASPSMCPHRQIDRLACGHPAACAAPPCMCHAPPSETPVPCTTIRKALCKPCAPSVAVIAVRALPPGMLPHLQPTATPLSACAPCWARVGPV